MSRARFIDRTGEGLRDAFMIDLTPAHIRGSAFGLRADFLHHRVLLPATLGDGGDGDERDNFRLVFWIAVIPAALTIAVPVLGIQESIPTWYAPRPLRLRRSDLAQFTGAFWWAIVIASLLSLARFSHAFLILKAYSTGIDAAYVPVMMILMHLVYALAAYPFGILADHINRRLQRALGAGVLIGADLLLASNSVAWEAMGGAAPWGLLMAIRQGLLAASVADAAPVAQRGTALGIHDLAIGAATFVASAAAGALCSLGGPARAFGFSGLMRGRSDCRPVAAAANAGGRPRPVSRVERGSCRQVTNQIEWARQPRKPVRRRGACSWR